MTSKSYQALGRLPKGVMNQTETAYAQYLELQKKAGGILDYRFEQVRFSMASNTNYLPDFLVINKNREVEFHEVKGRWEDDARVKIKVAQRQNPWFKFVAVMKKRVKDGGGWQFEEFAE